MTRLFTTIFLLLTIPKTLIAQNSNGFNKYMHPVGNPNEKPVCATTLVGNDLLVGGFRRLMRTNATGVAKWDKYCSATKLGTIEHLIPVSNVSVMFAATTGGNGISVGKVDTGGHFIWAKRLYNSVNINLLTMKKTYDNHVVLLCYDEPRTIVIKIDTLGNVLWSRHFYAPPPWYINGLRKNLGIAGNIVEMPDHSFMAISSCLSTAPDAQFGVETGAKVAVAMKISANGNLIWARKLHRFSAGIDIMPLSNNRFAYSIISRVVPYNMWAGQILVYIADSLGTPISDSVIHSRVPLRFISEWPVGRLNILQNGEIANDIGTILDDSQIITSDLNLNNISAVGYELPGRASLPGQCIKINKCFQRQDKAFIMTGTSTPELSESGMVVLVADSNRYQSCTSFPGVTYKTLDTGKITKPISMLVDSGIIEEPFVVYDSMVAYRLCNCDSMPIFRLSFTHIGSTFYFNDSSTNNTTYLWNFGDGSPLDSTKNPVHTYTDSLNYLITVRVSNNCGYGFFTYRLTDADTTIPPPPTTVSSANNIVKSYSIYPVPSKDWIQLIPSLPRDIILSIYDPLGRRVSESPADDKISVKELQPGIYYISFEKDGILHYLKFVKW